MIPIACNTGTRPAELTNLRWRDIMPAKDREGREIVVFLVLICRCPAKAFLAANQCAQAAAEIPGMSLRFV